VRPDRDDQADQGPDVGDALDLDRRLGQGRLEVADGQPEQPGDRGREDQPIRSSLRESRMFFRRPIGGVAWE
jgi:hypothetical protein